MTAPRPLKVGDRVRVLTGIREQQIAVVRRPPYPHGLFIHVRFEDGMTSPYWRESLRALPNRKTRRKP